MAGIYLHIPFCKQACTYCDFHFSTLLKNKPEFVKALCKEIELRKDYLETNSIHSIYFGGGTPSILCQEELQSIFDTLKKYFTWDKQIEITLECNPDDLNKEKLKELKEVGVNRLSVGLQSFNDDELKWMNRAHNAKESETCIKAAQEAGFNNITIDLIYGSKFQTIESWKQTLQKAIDLNVQHISSYNLTVEKKTKLGIDVLKGKEKEVDDEKSAEQFLIMIEMLEKNGFIHYEISNFAKPGYIAVHNSNYWKGEKYLGLGPSAHSFNGKTRQWNVANNNTYIKAISENSTYFEIENLTPENRYNEYVLTGLRTIWGCDIAYIQNNLGAEYVKHFVDEIEKQNISLYEKENTVYRLTKKGQLLADKIAMDLFA
ncbi:MAG: radical SAM family heme chaperone HemW [Bacteroidetes bacterium]|nr:radical SAM family heme chaperone HemW [Bacteroidota bacterium]